MTAHDALSHGETLLQTDQNDLASMDARQLEELLARTEAVLASVRALQTDARERLDDIRVVQALRQRPADTGREGGTSYADAHPDDTLDALGLPAHICDWLGPRGLGIRSVSLQLKRYPRSFLATQLRGLDERRRALDSASPALRDEDIDDMLDAVERALKTADQRGTAA